MNIEDIVPELFTEKRVYYCQRCLNHGLRLKRKNHKAECQFRLCQCPDCQVSFPSVKILFLEMVDKRRELNSRLLQMEEDEPCGTLPAAPTASRLEETPGGKAKERRPNCQRCAQHSVVNRLKGHKRCCPFRECHCAKCQVVVERQKLMADQIKLRRKQKKEKTLMESAHSPISSGSDASSSSSELCVPCAQQALSYHQLLSLFDPSLSVNPLLAFSAFLSACPHRAVSLESP